MVITPTHQCFRREIAEQKESVSLSKFFSAHYYWYGVQLLLVLLVLFVRGADQYIGLVGGAATISSISIIIIDIIGFVIRPLLVLLVLVLLTWYGVQISILGW